MLTPAKTQHRHLGHFGHKGHQAPQLGTRDTTGNLRQHRLGARDILGFRDTVGTLGTRDTRDITVTRDTTPCTYNGITVNLLRIASLCNNGFPISYWQSNSHLAIIKCLLDEIHVPDEISQETRNRTMETETEMEMERKWNGNGNRRTWCCSVSVVSV